LEYVLVYVYSSQYLTELLAERQKLGPFMQVLPLCTRLLNQGPFIPYPCIQVFCCDFSPLSFPFISTYLYCFIWIMPFHGKISFLVTCTSFSMFFLFKGFKLWSQFRCIPQYCEKLRTNVTDASTIVVADIPTTLTLRVELQPGTVF